MTRKLERRDAANPSTLSRAVIRKSGLLSCLSSSGHPAPANRFPISIICAGLSTSLCSGPSVTKVIIASISHNPSGIITVLGLVSANLLPHLLEGSESGGKPWAIAEAMERAQKSSWRRNGVISNPADPPFWCCKTNRSISSFDWFGSRRTCA